jgi:peptidoglycan hydrolase CwlO-like protein
MMPNNDKKAQLLALHDTLVATRTALVAQLQQRLDALHDAYDETNWDDDRISAEYSRLLRADEALELAEEALAEAIAARAEARDRLANM